MRRSTVTLFLCAAATAATIAQQASVPPESQAARPTFQSNVDVVRLDVSVLDRDRHPVRGLSAADFTVMEDGHERPIVAFAPIELPPAPTIDASTAVWTRDAPRDVVSNSDADGGRLVVLAFDWSIREDDIVSARQIALKVVDDLGPTDQAALVFTKPNAAAGTQQGFTTDHARLTAAIDGPFALPETCHEPGCEKIINPEHYGEGECLCGLCTLEAMTSLADMLRTVSERPKVVMFIGTYVRTFEAMVPTHIPPHVEGKITPTFTEMPGATDCSGRLLEARTTFEYAARAANMTIHVLDPSGLAIDDDTDPLGQGRMRERLNSLPVMADITGGRTVSDTNAPEDHVPSILDESGAYYVIGFTPGPGKVDKERRIDVRVKPRGLTAHARDAYTLADQKTPPGSAIVRSVSTVLPNADVPLEASVVPLIAGRRSAAVIVGRLERASAGPIQMIDAALTLRAHPVTSRRLTVQPVVARGAAPGPFALVSALALAPGPYEIRLGTELPDGTTGSVHAFVDVPNFEREHLSLSGVLIHVTPEEPAGPRQEIDDVLPFVPTARRAFTRSDVVSAFVQISQGTARADALEPVTLRVRVRDTQDRVVAGQTRTLAAAAFAINRTASSRLTIPIEGLISGDYLLSLDASMNKRSATRAVRFSIR